MTEREKGKGGGGGKTNLEDKASAQACSEDTVKHAITTARFTTVRMWVTLLFEMLDARLVLGVDDTRAEPSNAACQRKRCQHMLTLVQSKSKSKSNKSAMKAP